MKTPVLSVLIPTIPSRFKQFQELYQRMELQTRDRNVEILWVGDNKKRSIGLKRDALLRISKGEYIIFLDDDDTISNDYIVKLLQAAQSKPDVITFKQRVIIDGQEGVVDFDLHHKINEQFTPGETIKRKPFSVCAFRGELARRHKFPDSMYGEDWIWSEKVLADVKTQVKISEIIHTYIFDSEITEAR